MKGQIIMNDDDLQDGLTEFRETNSGNLFESGFYEWISKLEWITEHQGES
jgi:hypothetical protein